MKVTGAFLAEAAEAVDNKLNVRGGVISNWRVGPNRIARFVLVVLTQAETNNTDRRVVVDILPPISDEPLRLVESEVPEATANGEIGFLAYRLETTLRSNGRWKVVVTAAGGAVTLPLTVSGPQAG